MATIDEYSCTSLYVELIRDNNSFACGTAFVYEFSKNPYLITNWHNVTGKNPITGEVGTTPETLLAHFHSYDGLGKWNSEEIALLSDNGEPRWMEHPTYKSKVDVVAIPLEGLSDQLKFSPVNTRQLQTDMRTDVGRDLFILGFPFGIKAGGLFPIWKRASIASEPELDIDDLPKILVDTASRQGMSGSPVFSRCWGSYQSKSGGLNISSRGVFTDFVGIYSGRISGKNALEAQLGIVWKAHLIQEILEGGVVGSYLVDSGHITNK